ncbi:type VI secretion system Vgr family protein [Cystobacter fuscus]|uniref:type VI secretion system Vgr family protein n=1 Tax=Cystobacter fuscus TaxID=43 RepID=UPI002B28BD48|nr:type VI secretion system tip protein VgrG [Cystobacter fuscus]
MARTKGAAFTFRAGAYEAESFIVQGFSGTEGMSRLYEFQVEFHANEEGPLEAAALVDADALLTVALPESGTRCIRGMLRAVESLGRREGRWCYRAWLVPRLWRLTQVKRSRIFQRKSVPDIVKELLGEAGVEARWMLSGAHETREYCTQYRETDFAFLSRLLEWEGIFYFFEHTEEGHVLVIGDAPEVHRPLAGGAVLPLRARDNRVEEGEYLVALARIHRLRPGAVHLKDFNFEKPALDLSGRSASSEGADGLKVYDHPGEYETPGVGKGVSKVRMEELVQAAWTLEGEGVCPRLSPGCLFQVEDDGTHAGEYLAVRVAHFGEQPETPGNREALGGLYRNHFSCMPGSVPFRPRRTTPIPQIVGVQTATVVGPAGEEIHTDGHGRIKVQFHWDREGTRDDSSSCWIRVGQAWNGLAWGALYLPRVGHEVLVRFLEGNPDRPLLAGSVYNGNHPTPYALPAEKTRSTLKSASSPGSSGFNEVRIEDAAGSEELFIHAQKDEELLTENDKDQEVRGFESLLVLKDRQLTVEGNQSLAVTLDDEGLVEGNQSLRVQGHRVTTVGGDHSEEVSGSQFISIAQNRTLMVSQASTESVSMAKALTIGAGYAVNVGLVMNESVEQDKSVTVGAMRTERIVGARLEDVAEDLSVDVGAGYQSRIAGAMVSTVNDDLGDDVQRKSQLKVKDPAAWLSKSFSLKAETFSIKVGGKVVLQMKKSGAVKFSGNAITLDGSDIKFKGSKIKKKGGS